MIYHVARTAALSLEENLSQLDLNQGIILFLFIYCFAILMPCRPYRIYSKPESHSSNINTLFSKGLSTKAIVLWLLFYLRGYRPGLEVLNHWNSLGRPLAWYFFPFTWFTGFPE